MGVRFAKHERIISKKNVDIIYKLGKRIYSNSFVMIWGKHADEPIVKLLIVVPKKKIKRAVDRNYTKRIIRECYMQNKKLIYDLAPHPLAIILIYNKSTLPKFDILNSELLTLFKSWEKSKL